MNWTHTHWMIDEVMSEADEDRFPVMVDERGMVTTAPAWDGSSPVEHRDALIRAGWSLRKVSNNEALTYAQALEVS